MNITEKSIFNLIEIFRTTPKTAVQTVRASEHCEQKYHHDFYCDVEKPFVQTY
ncbi:hypothetical protein AB9K32_14740 [Allomuricauda sp. XS_ASV26]|jgi:hypothetical protein|uniref:hypothetical protein n=1 Tax=Flavobacteriaceae TaxID=49546 RepID=UPI002075B8AF|nr:MULTISPECIES: hypothetical protein [Allomuricauda]USD26477.1 hypothetical protein MJO53_06170 [Allomuricauda aquimarina]